MNVLGLCHSVAGKAWRTLPEALGFASSGISLIPRIRCPCWFCEKSRDQHAADLVIVIKGRSRLLLPRYSAAGPALESGTATELHHAQTSDSSGMDGAEMHFPTPLSLSPAMYRRRAWVLLSTHLWSKIGTLFCTTEHRELRSLVVRSSTLAHSPQRLPNPLSPTRSPLSKLLSHSRP